MQKKSLLEKGESKINGIGILANALISSGEVFYSIPNTKFSTNSKRRWARIGNKYICDENVLNFINHSCKPNAFIDVNNFTLVAIRDIPFGEEITVDYDKTEIDGEKIPCSCKNQNCKGYFKAEL
jgi:hypothetical protein